MTTRAIYRLSFGGILAISFGTIVPTLAQLTITSVSPTPNLRNAPRTSPIIATFNEPLSSGSTSAVRVFSTQQGGLRSGHSGTTIVTGNQLSFTPTGNWKPGETVRTIITTNAQNNSGQPLPKSRIFDFTAAVGGSGLGSFASSSTFTVGAYPSRICLADVDGDSDLDMLSSNSNTYGGSYASIRFNNGQGQFAGGSEVQMATGSKGAYYLTLGDIDGDGDLDLLTSNSIDYVSVRFNDGTGSYTMGDNLQISKSYKVNDLALSDVDGDGDLDLLINSQPDSRNGLLSLRLNNGTGQFSGGYDLDLGNKYGGRIKTADLDNDGDLDLVRSSTNSTNLFIHLNDGTGNFRSISTYPITGYLVADLDLGDLDGDGDIDLLAMDNNGLGQVETLLNNGAGAFTKNATIAAFGNPSTIALNDVDADGDLDLLLASSSSISVHFNNGQGTFSSYYRLTDKKTDVFATGDIDNDGDLDIVTELHPDSPPSPPCLVYTYLNQPTSPTLILNNRNPLTAQVELYPNPAQQQCTLVLPAQLHDAALTLFNALGQKVTTPPLPKAVGGRSTDINLSGLAPGLYTLRISTPTETLVKQLIKE